MGATTFMIEQKASSADEAFEKAILLACYDHGHSGYTGTVAEKNSFIMIDLPNKTVNPEDFASSLLDDDDDRISDKWGPAGCIQVEVGRYLFFGWAST